MKAKQVLQLLQITRNTLTKYCKQGLITYDVLPNGRYDYHETSVYAFLNKGVPRKTVIYARVSTTKQKTDLQNQVQGLKSFCLQSGWTIQAIFQDVASGISFQKRTAFFEMLNLILNHQVERVVISYKDRLSRIGFELFLHLFQRFGSEIVVMSEIGSEKLDSQEIFEEIVSLLHCYSMKLYSSRRKKLVEELCYPEK